MSKAQRTKGHSWEREVAAFFRTIGFPKAKRGLQTQRVGKVPDVEGPLWWVECKVGARPNIGKAMDQARRDYSLGASDEYTAGPLVITKQDRQEPLVTMTLGQFGLLVTSLVNAHQKAKVGDE